MGTSTVDVAFDGLNLGDSVGVREGKQAVNPATREDPEDSEDVQLQTALERSKVETSKDVVMDEGSSGYSGSAGGQGGSGTSPEPSGDESMAEASAEAPAEAPVQTEAEANAEEAQLQQDEKTTEAYVRAYDYDQDVQGWEGERTNTLEGYDAKENADDNAENNRIIESQQNFMDAYDMNLKFFEIRDSAVSNAAREDDAARRQQALNDFAYQMERQIADAEREKTEKAQTMRNYQAANNTFELAERRKVLADIRQMQKDEMFIPADLKKVLDSSRLFREQAQRDKQRAYIKLKINEAETLAARKKAEQEALLGVVPATFLERFKAALDIARSNQAKGLLEKQNKKEGNKRKQAEKRKQAKADKVAEAAARAEAVAEAEARGEVLPPLPAAAPRKKTLSKPQKDARAKAEVNRKQKREELLSAIRALRRVSARSMKLAPGTEDEQKPGLKAGFNQMVFEWNKYTRTFCDTNLTQPPDEDVKASQRTDEATERKKARTKRREAVDALQKKKNLEDKVPSAAEYNTILAELSAIMESPTWDKLYDKEWYMQRYGNNIINRSHCRRQFCGGLTEEDLKQCYSEDPHTEHETAAAYTLAQRYVGEKPCQSTLQYGVEALKQKENAKWPFQYSEDRLMDSDRPDNRLTRLTPEEMEEAQFELITAPLTSAEVDNAWDKFTKTAKQRNPPVHPTPTQTVQAPVYERRGMVSWNNCAMQSQNDDGVDDQNIPWTTKQINWGVAKGRSDQSVFWSAFAQWYHPKHEHFIGGCYLAHEEYVEQQKNKGYSMGPFTETEEYKKLQQEIDDFDFKQVPTAWAGRHDSAIHVRSFLGNGAGLEAWHRFVQWHGDPDPEQDNTLAQGTLRDANPDTEKDELKKSWIEVADAKWVKENLASRKIELKAANREAKARKEKPFTGDIDDPATSPFPPVAEVKRNKDKYAYPPCDPGSIPDFSTVKFFNNVQAPKYLPLSTFIDYIFENAPLDGGKNWNGGRDPNGQVYGKNDIIYKYDTEIGKKTAKVIAQVGPLTAQSSAELKELEEDKAGKRLEDAFTEWIEKRQRDLQVTLRIMGGLCIPLPSAPSKSADSEKGEKTDEAEAYAKNAVRQLWNYMKQTAYPVWRIKDEKVSIKKHGKLLAQALPTDKAKYEPVTRGLGRIEGLLKPDWFDSKHYDEYDRWGYDKWKLDKPAPALFRYKNRCAQAPDLFTLMNRRFPKAIQEAMDARKAWFDSNGRVDSETPPTFKSNREPWTLSVQAPVLGPPPGTVAGDLCIDRKANIDAMSEDNDPPVFPWEKWLGPEYYSAGHPGSGRAINCELPIVYGPYGDGDAEMHESDEDGDDEEDKEDDKEDDNDEDIDEDSDEDDDDDDDDEDRDDEDDEDDGEASEDMDVDESASEEEDSASLQLKRRNSARDSPSDNEQSNSQAVTPPSAQLDVRGGGDGKRPRISASLRSKLTAALLKHRR